MAFIRPTLAQIITRISNDITGAFGADASVLRRAFTKVLTRAYAAACHLLYGYIDYLSRQIMPDTAEDEELIRWANIYGLQQKPATFWEGVIEITGNGGTVIESGFLWARADGVQYRSTALVTIPGSGPHTTTVAIIAVLAGSLSNLPNGQQLAPVSPLSGLDEIATITDNDDGANAESITELRERLLLRIQKPPQGGSKSDYVQWALEVPGIGFAYPYAPKEIQLSPPIPPFGHVYVYVASNDPENPTPTGGVVDDAQEYLDSKKPLTAYVDVIPIATLEINFVMNVTKSLNVTDEVAEANIKAELDDLLLREGKPLATIRLSQLNEAISNANGEVSHTMSVPSADIDLAVDEFALVGTITITFV